MYHQPGRINVIVSKQYDKEALSRLWNEVPENYKIADLRLGTEQDFCMYPYDRKIMCDHGITEWVIRAVHKGGERFSMDASYLFTPDFTAAILF